MVNPTRLATGASSGAIALRNSTQKAIGFSPSVSETAPRVRSLHRDFLRSVPWIKWAFGVMQSDAVRGARENILAELPRHHHPFSRSPIFSSSASLCASRASAENAHVCHC